MRSIDVRSHRISSCMCCDACRTRRPSRSSSTEPISATVRPSRSISFCVMRALRLEGSLAESPLSGRSASRYTRPTSGRFTQTAAFDVRAERFGIIVEGEPWRSPHVLLVVLDPIYRTFCRMGPWLVRIPRRGGPDSHSLDCRGHLLDRTFCTGPSVGQPHVRRAVSKIVLPRLDEHGQRRPTRPCAKSGRSPPYTATASYIIA